MKCQTVTRFSLRARPDRWSLTTLMSGSSGGSRVDDRIDWSMTRAKLSRGATANAAALRVAQWALPFAWAFAFATMIALAANVTLISAASVASQEYVIATNPPEVGMECDSAPDMNLCVPAR